MKNIEKIHIHLENIIVETLLSPLPPLYKLSQSEHDPIIKQADILPSLSDVANWFKIHTQGNTFAGIANFVLPGMIGTLLGGGIIGFIVVLLLECFDVKVYDILKSIFEKLIPYSKDNPPSNADVHNIVETEVNKHTTSTVSEEQAEKAAKKIEEGKSIFSIESLKAGIRQLFSLQSDVSYNEYMIKSCKMFPMELRYIKLLKLSSNNFHKSAGVALPVIKAIGLKAGLIEIIKKVFKFIVRAAILAVSGAFGGDVVKHYTDKPNAIDQVRGTQPTTTQKVFPVNESYPYRDKIHDPKDPWIVKGYSRDDTGIQNMLLDMTNRVYKGLKDHKDLIINSPGFRATVDTISDYNIQLSGVQIGGVLMPRFFKSEQQVIDYFIDDIAHEYTAKGYKPNPVPASTPA